MVLTEEVKQKILENSATWYNKQYGSLTEEKRKELGAFYTPGGFVIKMIEKFSDMEGKICDPTCGSGNLLVGCIIAGADPKKIYGIELDAEMAELCRNRLSEFGVPRENIVTGDALSQATWRKLEGKRFSFGGKSF